MQIHKKIVDDHSPKSMVVPHCELVAVWIKGNQQTSQVNSLIHRINILGTSDKEMFFKIIVETGM